MNRERFRFFQSSHFESDLLIGVPIRQYSEPMGSSAMNELTRLRKLLMDFMLLNPGFRDSLEPLPPDSLHGRQKVIPDEISCMIRCGAESGTGPMSSVAGLFAEYVGRKLMVEYKVDEIVVENGGDLYLNVRNEVLSMIHAGSSTLSDRLAFVITPGEWGICTSSGTIGHSFSRGRADAVTIIAESAPLADSWATALANLIKTAADIDKVMDLVSANPEIRGCAVIAEERVGVRGSFELKLLN